ncbi:claudin-7-like [Oryzias latipes]
MAGLQIVAFLSGLVGLGAIIGATVSNEWRATSRASSVITATWVLQGLWKNCAGNAIGALHCRPHHTIFGLEDYIQACRGLMIAAVCLGFFGCVSALVGMKCTKIGGSDQSKTKTTCFAGINFVLGDYVQAVRGLLMCGLTIGFFAVVCCFIGMDCTYIGGAEQTKDKLVFSGAVFHFGGGVSNLAAYCLYINRIAKVAFAPTVPGVLKYDLGPPIFLGLVGCFLIFFGAILYAVTVFRVIYRRRSGVQTIDGGTYMIPLARGRSMYAGYNPSRITDKYPQYQIPGYNFVPSRKSLTSLGRTETTYTRQTRSPADSRASTISEISSATKTTRTTASNAYV